MHYTYFLLCRPSSYSFHCLKPYYIGLWLYHIWEHKHIEAAFERETLKWNQRCCPKLCWWSQIWHFCLWVTSKHIPQLIPGITVQLCWENQTTCQSWSLFKKDATQPGQSARSWWPEPRAGFSINLLSFSHFCTLLFQIENSHKQLLHN